MTKFDYQFFCLELTRKCNLTCAHCRCGDAQNVSMPEDILYKALDNVNWVIQLDIFDGEPFLEPELLEKMVDYIIDNDIAVFSCVVMTNGTVFGTAGIRCIEALNRLGAHCVRKRQECIPEYQPEDPLFVAVSIADDQFHNNDPKKARDFYQHFASEYVKVNIAVYENPDRHDPHDLSWLTREGRAAVNFPDKGKPVGLPCHIDTDGRTRNTGNTLINDMIEVTVEGNVLTHEGVSYDKKKWRSMGNIKHDTLADLIETWNSSHLLSRYESGLEAFEYEKYGSGEKPDKGPQNIITTLEALKLVYAKVGNSAKFRGSDYSLQRRTAQLLLIHEWITELLGTRRDQKAEESIIDWVFEIAGDKSRGISSKPEVEYSLFSLFQLKTNYQAASQVVNSFLTDDVKLKLKELNIFTDHTNLSLIWRFRYWIADHIVFCFAAFLTLIAIIQCMLVPSDDMMLLYLVLLFDVLLSAAYLLFGSGNGK